MIGEKINDQRSSTTTELTDKVIGAEFSIRFLINVLNRLVTNGIVDDNVMSRHLLAAGSTFREVEELYSNKGVPSEIIDRSMSTAYQDVTSKLLLGQSGRSK